MDSAEAYMPERDYSDETARMIDEEVRRMVDESYADAVTLLSERWDQVERVADALLRFETLTADEVRSLMRGEELSKPSITDLLKKSRRSTPPSPSGSTRTGDEPDAAGDGIVPSPA